MEDIRLGRKSQSIETTRSISNVASELIEQDLLRTSIVISAPITNRVTLSMKSGVTDANGIVLYPGQAPLVLDLIHHGDMVRRALFAITVAGVENIGVWQSHLEEE